MIWLYIILAILALIALLLFVPLRISFKYYNKGRIIVYLGIIPVYITSKRKKLKKKPDKEKKGKTEKDKQTPEGKGISFVLETIKKIGNIVSDTSRTVRKHIHINIKQLDLIIGCDDAALTGELYGAVCASVYPVLNSLKAFVNLKVRHLRISPDFISRKTYVQCNIVLWILPIFAINILTSIIINGISILTDKNGKNTNNDKQNKSTKKEKGSAIK